MSPEQLQAEQQQIADQTANAVAMNTVANQARLEGREEARQMTEEAHDNFLRDKAAQVIHKSMAAQQAQQKIDEEFRRPVEEVDPLKVIKEMDTGDMILGALAVIASSIGAAMQRVGGNPNAVNLAMQSLDRMIANSIAAQKDAIDRGERKSRNRVAHWTKVMNDNQDGADLALSEAYLAAGRRMQYLAAAEVENADIQASMMQQAQQIIAKGEERAATVEAREAERISTTFQPPAPPPMQTPVDAWKQAEAASKLQELQGTGRRPEQNKELRTATTTLSNQLDDVNSIRSGLDGLYRAAGVERDEATGELVAADIPGRGPADAALASMAEWPAWTGVGLAGQAVEGATGKRQPRKAVEAALENVIDLLVRERTGAAVTKVEQDQFREILGGEGWRESDFLTKLRTFDDFLRQREKEIRSGAEPNALEEYEERRRRVNASRAGVSYVQGAVQ